MKMSWSKKQKLTGYLFIAPNMIGIIIFFLVPAIVSMIVMFTDLNFLSIEPINFIGLNNFVKVFKDETFYTALKNTLIFLLGVPVSIAIAVVLAIFLNNKIFLKPVLRAMYFIPYITSSVAIAFVWSLLFQPTSGPINGFLRTIGLSEPPRWLASTETSMYAIDIIWIWYTLGFNMIVYLAALQEIPAELLEAAKKEYINQRNWDSQQTTDHPEINKVISYITQTYYKEISLRMLADYVGMDANYLSNLFKKKTGQNIIQYIHRVRIEQAKSYLKQTGLSVNEIGEKVGFVNDNYFIKIFRRLTNQTPSHFRRLNS